jgi:Nucleolar protein 12 (25kDa)
MSKRYRDEDMLAYKGGGDDRMSKRKQRNKALEIVFDPSAHKYVCQKYLMLLNISLQCMQPVLVQLLRFSSLPLSPPSSLLPTCREYITGFRKRKQARRKDALSNLEKKQRQQRIEERAEVRN